MPERLLEDDTAARLDEPDLVEAVADRPEEGRPDGEVEDPDRVRPLAEAIPECVPVVRLVDVEAHVLEPRGEVVDLARRDAGDELRERAAHLVAVAGVVETGAGDGDDARLCGQLSVAQSEQQGGEQLAQGEVARASEDDEVGGLERRGHVHGR